MSNKSEDNLRNIRNQKPKSYSLDRFDPKLKNTLKAADINKFASPFLLCSVHPYHINPNINVKDVKKELQPVLKDLLDARKEASKIKHEHGDSFWYSDYKNKKQEHRDKSIKQWRNTICENIEYNNNKMVLSNNRKKTPKDEEHYVEDLKKRLPHPPSDSIETPKTKYEIAVQKMREKYPGLVAEHERIMKDKEIEKRRANLGPIQNRNIKERIALLESIIDKPPGTTNKEKEDAIKKALMELAALEKLKDLPSVPTGSITRRTKGGKTRKYKRKRQRRKSKNTKRR
jgi:hypothetical protein